VESLAIQSGVCAALRHRTPKASPIRAQSVDARAFWSAVAERSADTALDRGQLSTHTRFVPRKSDMDHWSMLSGESLPTENVEEQNNSIQKRPPKGRYSSLTPFQVQRQPEQFLWQ
jgi:hypothetical protein